jgi:hypothetical protein
MWTIKRFKEWMKKCGRYPRDMDVMSEAVCLILDEESLKSS